MTQSGIKLYDYQNIESATNLLRYRHFIKRNLKLYREIFSRFEGNSSKSSRILKSQQTFDTQKKLAKVVSSTNLLKFIKEFELMPQAGGFISSLRIRQDVPMLIKLINQLPECGMETKLAELSFDGFVEFIV